MTAIDVARQRVELGLPMAVDGLPPHTRRALRLAEELGAPRGPVLAAAAASEAAALALRREVAVAAAGPRAVARGLALLPPVLGPATALLVSDDPFAVWGTPVGRVLALLAVVAWLVGLVAIRLLAARASSPPRPADDVPHDEVLDLLAIATTAGVGPVAAVRAVRVVTRDPALDHLALWLELGGTAPAPTGWLVTGPVLVAAVRDGLPVAGLLRRRAAALRDEAHQAALQRVARLEARLAVPTTLLLLPAAGLVVAAPLVHGLLTGLGA